LINRLDLAINSDQMCTLYILCFHIIIAGARILRCYNSFDETCGKLLCDTIRIQFYWWHNNAIKNKGHGDNCNQIRSLKRPLKIYIPLKRLSNEILTPIIIYIIIVRKDASHGRRDLENAHKYIFNDKLKTTIIGNIM
jgi:hypothetical protein